MPDQSGFFIPACPSRLLRAWRIVPIPNTRHNHNHSGFTVLGMVGCADVCTKRVLTHLEPAMRVDVSKARIAKIDVSATDTIVLMVPGVISERQREWLTERVKRQLPVVGHILILDGGVGLAVIAGKSASGTVVNDLVVSGVAG